MDCGGRDELGTLEAEQVPAGGAGALSLDLKLIVRCLNVAQEGLESEGIIKSRE